ncbi:NETI motif-containing protein [Aliicoccus persicus]|uniref:NETI protein n=1 Tax=Aliicoccus persicus TaxID=930138 RepID=A0A662Z748_9STAP|nr:NETI motif-containing protein [Aliicoccus persicus]SEW11551.1 NETI protein [Aliicoccus persicus]
MAKKKFKVEDNESIDDCLARMKEEGYTPVRRMEKPVFKEENGETVVSHQEIVFEGKKL